MTSPKVTCDGCGVVKKEANNWFRLFANESAGNFSTTDERYTEERDFCGINCTLQYISKLLEKQHGS